MIKNPKRSTDSVEGKISWYEYYAGYSHSFTKSVLDSANISSSSIVLDPWNGAGTTTLISSLEGYKSIGVDLNPVMNVIAKAKQAPRKDIEYAISDSFTLTARYQVKQIEGDPLLSWMTKSSVASIRKVEKFILKGKKYSSAINKAKALSYMQCIQYVALFNAVRYFLAEFIPTNPTWIKKANDDAQKIDFSWVDFKKKFQFNVSKLSDKPDVLPSDKHHISASLLISSSSKLPLDNNSVDLVLSSPPYCTRIDYAVATLPELSILSAGGEKEIDSIRRSLMGSTTVPKNVPENISLGSACDSFLNSVKQHPSKASGTYYYKNFFQYFYELLQSVKEVVRVLKPKGKCYLVVQDSYYKDIHCDLAGIIVDMFHLNSAVHVTHHNFQAQNNMANINSKSNRYRANVIPIETVLELTKVE